MFQGRPKIPTGNIRYMNEACVTGNGRQWNKTKEKSRKFPARWIYMFLLSVTQCAVMVNLNRVCMFDRDQ